MLLKEKLQFRVQLLEKMMNVTGCLLRQPEGSWKSCRFSKEELAVIAEMHKEAKEAAEHQGLVEELESLNREFHDNLEGKELNLVSGTPLKP